ncbi:hypothetical protein EYV94_18400 [Puteibacter caeruleilacunae]|nr:hypothetical protein EYV94_18400 [Puteibacter caeruleilacunae]
MYYENYKKKSNNQLKEILNSDLYHLTARETAQKILEERNVTYQIVDDKPQLFELDCYQLFEKLDEYGLIVYTSKRMGIIEIKQGNNGLLIGLILIALSFICFTVLLTVIFMGFEGSYRPDAGSGVHVMKGWLVGGVSFLIVGSMNYQRDKKAKIRIQFNQNSIKIRKRKIWKKEAFDLSLNSTDIEYKKTKKGYLIFTRWENSIINLFDFQDTNIGDKTEDFLSILTESLNKEVKAE